MKQIHVLLVILFFCACIQQNGSEKTTRSELPIVSNNLSFDSVLEENDGQNKAQLESYNWDNYQDSLRNEILNAKENKILKKSFLQEMYIRNVVTTSKDSLYLKIPFNLHGPDCGAPDCYSTDVSFNFKLDDTLIFPKIIQFREHEHGCVEKELKLSGSFKLLEQTESHVIYYSTNHKRTLVLFSSFKDIGTTAYYFKDLGQNRINGQNVYSILNEYEEQNENSVYPFMSWVLTTNDYENFMPQ